MKLFLSFYVFLSSFFVFAQDKMSATFLDSISINADFFIGRDNFNNYYSIKDNAFQKTSALKQQVYKNIALGNLTYVDITNPLQIVLLYKDYNTIVLLDNQLSEIHRINGNDYNLVFEACGLSIQNKLWFYDILNLKIGLFQLEDASIKFISTPLDFPIQKFNSNYNSFYWIDSDNNGYSISFFGKIKRLGKLPNLEAINFNSASDYIYKIENELFFVNLVSNTKSIIEIDKKTIANFSLKSEILSIFTNNTIFNYKLNIP